MCGTFSSKALTASFDKELRRVARACIGLSASGAFLINNAQGDVSNFLFRSSWLSGATLSRHAGYGPSNTLLKNTLDLLFILFYEYGCFA